MAYFSQCRTAARAGLARRSPRAVRAGRPAVAGRGGWAPMLLSGLLARRPLGASGQDLLDLLQHAGEVEVFGVEQDRVGGGAERRDGAVGVDVVAPLDLCQDFGEGARQPARALLA